MLKVEPKKLHTSLKKPKQSGCRSISPASDSFKLRSYTFFASHTARELSVAKLERYCFSLQSEKLIRFTNECQTVCLMNPIKEKK